MKHNAAHIVGLLSGKELRMIRDRFDEWFLEQEREALAAEERRRRLLIQKSARAFGGKR